MTIYPVYLPVAADPVREDTVTLEIIMPNFL